MAKEIAKKNKKYLQLSHGGKKEITPRRPRFIQKAPPCTHNCPNHNKIRKAITVLSQAKEYGKTHAEALEKAWYTFMETTPFPAVLGRVCLNLCESDCNRKKKDGALAINSIERYIGDFGLEKKLKPRKLTEKKREERVAIIGSGPAGLSCAYHLARRGYRATVYEAFPKAGGMLRYGIPSYRLPEDILDAEIQRILDMGVDIKLNTIVGKEIKYEDLRHDNKAIFIGIGAHKGKNLGIPGDDAQNVWTGTAFLNKINRGELIDIGDKAVIIGGGDTAIDGARIALRLGAKSTMLYRRSKDEMPAMEEEIQGAKEEGVDIQFLATPIEIYKKGDRGVKMKCQKMELGEPDASGRRRPLPIEGDTFEMEFTTMICAISQEPDFIGMENIVEGREWIKTDDKQKTKLDGVYSGGDNIDLGIAVTALYHGRRAAEAIHEYIAGEPMPPEPEEQVAHKVRTRFFEEKERYHLQELPVEERLDGDISKEIVQSMSEEQAFSEAKRCFSCGKCFNCESCWASCREGGIIKPMTKGKPYKVKEEACIGCGRCAASCPCGFLEMV